MKRALPALILAAVTLSAMLAGCGGNTPVDIGSARVVPAAIDLSVRNLSAANVRAEPARAEWFGPQRFDDTPVRLNLDDEAPARRVRPEDVIDFGALPALPPYDAPHAASDVYQLDLATPAQHTGSVSPSAGSLLMTSLPGWTEWAWYTIPLFSGEDLNALSVTGSMLSSPNGDDSGLWVGVSNYSLGRWEFFGPYDLSSMVVLNLPDVTYADSGGVGHFLVVVVNGDAAEITRLQYDIETQEDVVLPQEFYTALTNAGLNPFRLGMTEVDIFGVVQGMVDDWSFGWNIYEIKPPEEDDEREVFQDLHTILPNFWNGWFGSEVSTDTNPDPFQPKDYAKYVKDKATYLDNATALQDVFMAGVEEMPGDKRVEPQSYDPALEPGDPLANAIADYVTAAGGTADFPTYRDALSALSTEDQQPLARVVLAALDAIQARNDVLMTDIGFDEAMVQGLFDAAHGVWVEGDSGYYPFMIGKEASPQLWMRAFPYPAAFFEGAGKLTDAVDQLREYIETSSPSWEDVSLDVDTDWGRISIGGTGNDTYAQPADDGYALLIELGGADEYTCTAGATASGPNGVSVALDLSGADTYNALDNPLDSLRGIDNNDHTSQYGAGRIGIGMLVDFDGVDTYDAVRMSEGFAMWGVGILADYGSDDDTYGLEAYGQGGAIGGIGILYDDGGEVSGDAFNIWAFGQGYGGVMGIGLLVHHGESNDAYYAEPDFAPQRPEYGSAQDATKNANFAQGAAFGMRWPGWVEGGLQYNADTRKWIVGAGGYGLLYDQDGNEDYECGIFGMGTAFFHGHGLLIDQDGDDQRTAVRYAQGATAHVALAGLWDGGGEDYYENQQTVGIGGAHDLSITWFLERGGNDQYSGAGYAFGCSLNNGFAYFVDYSGNDEYRPDYADGTVFTLGRGGWPGGSFTVADDPTYGIFVDVTGTDIYDPVYAGMLSGLAVDEVIATPPQNIGQWVRINGNPDAGNGFYAEGYGSGLDGP